MEYLKKAFVFGKMNESLLGDLKKVFQQAVCKKNLGEVLIYRKSEKNRSISGNVLTNILPTESFKN